MQPAPSFQASENARVMQNQAYNHDIQNSEFAAPVATVSNFSESLSIS